jgi:predicted dehydrogenase
VALKLREIIEKGTIGKVLNVEARIASPGSKRDAVPDSLDYFVRKEVGGNPITIAFAHSEWLCLLIQHTCTDVRMMR